MTTLLTGSAGFLGRHLRPLLVEDEVVEIDRVTGFDLTDPGVAMKIGVQEIDTVYHLAAEHFVPWCRLHPVETLQTNVGGTMNLLAGLESHPPERIIFTSSAAVYGLSESARLEADPLHPIDIYGWSKVIGEELLAAYAQRHPETSCVSARLSNLVGPDDPHEHVVPVLLAAKRKDDVPSLGNLWPRRDYVHVDDVADALMSLSALKPGYHVYNVATGIGTSVMGLLAMLGWPHWSVDPDKMRVGDGHLVLSPHKIQADTGWIARHSITEVLAA